MLDVSNLTADEIISSIKEAPRGKSLIFYRGEAGKIYDDSFRDGEVFKVWRWLQAALGRGDVTLCSRKLPTEQGKVGIIEHIAQRVKIIGEVKA